LARPVAHDRAISRCGAQPLEAAQLSAPDPRQAPAAVLWQSARPQVCHDRNSIRRTPRSARSLSAATRVTAEGGRIPRALIRHARSGQKIQGPLVSLKRRRPICGYDGSSCGRSSHGGEPTLEPLNSSWRAAMGRVNERTRLPAPRPEPRRRWGLREDAKAAAGLLAQLR